MAAKSKGISFAKLKKEAEAKAAKREPRKVLPPFVINDVEPPIEITMPDTNERQLMIAEMVGRNGDFDPQHSLPLLRALCGPAFGRVWMLVRDDKEPDTLIALIQAIFMHFQDTIEVMQAAEEELPGGSEDSSA